MSLLLASANTETHQDAVSQYIKDHQWVVAVIGVGVTALLGLTAFTVWSVCLYPPAYHKLII